jgi:hypothetical protein
MAHAHAARAPLVLGVGGAQLYIKGQAGRVVALEDLHLAVDTDVAAKLAIDEKLTQRVLERALIDVLDARTARALGRRHDMSLERRGQSSRRRQGIASSSHRP